MDIQIAKSDLPHKTGVPGKSTVPLRSEPAQKATFDGQSGRLSTSTVPLLNAAASLGLPKDALSVALLVFTRFFSLSADKTLIGSLRREILDLLKTSTLGSADEKAALEARAMAAVAAADKGVVLSPAALERYARFLLPAVMPKTHEEKETASPKTVVSTQGNKEESLKEIPEPDELKAIAETQMREDDLLDLFNYLPGKNGQYWLVFPFKINVNGIELKVLLRVLRSEHGTIPGRPSAPEDGQLIADISGPRRQWRCFMKKTAGKFRADIRVYPEYPQRSLNYLQKKAKLFLGKGGGLDWSRNTGSFGGFEEIIVRNGDKMPLWAEDLWPDLLPFIDKEV